MVKLFYLPQTRWVVNLERLPDAAVDVSQSGLAASVSDVLAGSASDDVSAAEARAKAAALEHQMDAYLPRTPPPARQPARAEELIGTWTSPFLTVSIQEEGTFATRLPDGTDSTGRWSIDPDGVEGEWLTLSIAGQPLKLRRSSAA